MKILDETPERPLSCKVPVSAYVGSSKNLKDLKDPGVARPKTAVVSSLAYVYVLDFEYRGVPRS